MEDLKNHVDKLFKKYKNIAKIEELKEEVLSNLEDKVKDLTSKGVSLEEAVKKAISDINDVDYLIEDGRKVYINRFRNELLQVMLLYFIIAWIITTPFRIMGIGVLLNLSLLGGCFVLGAFFIASSKKLKNDEKYYYKTWILSLKGTNKFRRCSWIAWILYVIVTELYSTALRFGSNIWFKIPIRISGPYEFGILAIKYFLPLVFIIFPLIFNAAVKLIYKYEVDNYENY